MRRGAGLDPQGGVFAVLYAALVIVLIAIAAIVVDLNAVREDRRLDRSAADSAAIAGAAQLLPTNSGGASPYQACLNAWAYLDNALKISTPVGACGVFSGKDATYCATTPVLPIPDPWTVGRRYITITWPVPRGNALLTPDLTPGSASQTFQTSTDGSDAGCDRIGVMITENQPNGLGAALGDSATRTTVHSVALASVTTGPGQVIAALNVLNPVDCQTLRASGGGQVFVDPTINKDGTRSAGTIAVESAGNTSSDSPRGNCSGQNTVITNNGATDNICANGVNSTITGCDGKGVIYSHALDLGKTSVAYNNADVLSGVLNPKPRTEGGTHSYTPVTQKYGCNTTRLPLCVPPTSPLPNYISNLETAFNASPPNPYLSTQPPYNASYPFTGAFQNATSRGACGTINGTVTLPANGAPGSTGNWYCPAGIQVNGTLIIPNGNLVVQNGDLVVSNGGCLILNTTATSCSSANINSSGGPTQVTTIPKPTASSIVYLKNGSFAAKAGSSFLLPQTFMYEYGANAGTISFDATTVALWTAPGAGLRDQPGGRTALEQACYDAATGQPNDDCMNSAFARLAFWSDFPATNTGSTKDTFTGGSSNTFVVGVFFTPTSFFSLAGSSSLPLVSQFWCDILNVVGGARLPLTPTDTEAIPINIGVVGLIR